MNLYEALNELEKQEKVDEKLCEDKETGRDLAEYQKWVDYDMKKYGKISEETQKKVKDAGLEIIKDQYGDYEVIAKEDDGIDESCATNESCSKKKSVKKLTEEWDSSRSDYEFFTWMSEMVDKYTKKYLGNDYFWEVEFRDGAPDTIPENHKTADNFGEALAVAMKYGNWYGSDRDIIIDDYLKQVRALIDGNDYIVHWGFIAGTKKPTFIIPRRKDDKRIEASAELNEAILTAKDGKKYYPIGNNEDKDHKIETIVERLMNLVDGWYLDRLDKNGSESYESVFDIPENFDIDKCEDLIDEIRGAQETSIVKDGILYAEGKYVKLLQKCIRAYDFQGLYELFE